MLATSRLLIKGTSRTASLARKLPLTYKARWLSIDSSSPVNFYTLLNVPQSFGIDETQLKQNYRDLMNQHHPDKFNQNQPSLPSSGSVEDAMSDAHDHASLVTLAYDTLKRPHTRAQHLLALETGLNLADDHQEQVQNGEKLLGMETLMEIMELREAIEHAASNDEATLKQLLQDNQERIQATSEQLEAAFQAKEYDAALVLTAKMQYWNRIHETIREKMHAG